MRLIQGLEGDLALVIEVAFWVVPEHRLILAGAQSAAHKLTRQGLRSVCVLQNDGFVWFQSCQSQGSPVVLPSSVTEKCMALYLLGRAVRCVLYMAGGGKVHVFVSYEYQGSDRDSEALGLVDRLLAALREARGLAFCTSRREVDRKFMRPAMDHPVVCR